MENNKIKKYIHLTAGRGPIECQYAVAKVLHIFLNELSGQGFQARIIQRTIGEENTTLQSATVFIESVEQAFLDKWIGSILWIEKSPYRKTQKRKNWFIGIFELKGYMEIKWRDTDIEFETMRSSGAGGQNVNKVNSAVRVRHIPTKITVTSQETRSQYQNKQIALERLKQKIDDANLDKIKSQITEQWEQQLILKRGEPIQIFSGESFRKKKDIKNYKKQRNALKAELRIEKKLIE